MNTNLRNVKREENYESHFGVSEKRSRTKRVTGKTKPANKHVRAKTENLKENSRSVSTLFLLMTCCFTLSSERGRLIFHTLFLSSDDYLKSVVAVKINQFIKSRNILYKFKKDTSLLGWTENFSSPSRNNKAN